MRTIAKLFGRSPFMPLQAHMEKVKATVDKSRELVEAFYASDHDQVALLAKEVSKLEHVADEARHDIQSQLSKGMFMAVDRGRLLEILETQDNLADVAENIGILLTLKPINLPDTFKTEFQAFVDINYKAFDTVTRIVDELDELLETGFGGAEAERVRQMVMEVAKLEHEADVMQRVLLQKLFAEEDGMSVATFYLWDKIFGQVSRLSDTAEHLAHGIRRTLELK